MTEADLDRQKANTLLIREMAERLRVSPDRILEKILTMVETLRKYKQEIAILRLRLIP